MVKTIGRIILLAVAGVLIWQGVTNFMNDFELIKSYSGGFLQLLKDFINNENARNLVINFFKDIFWLLVACSALLAAIFGHGGFWMTIFTLISLGLIGYNIYTKVKAGEFSKDLMGTIKTLIIDFACQLGYVVGVIMIKIGNSIQEAADE